MEGRKLPVLPQVGEPAARFLLRHLLVVMLMAAASPAQVANEEWPAYGRDSGGTRYSPLKQITRENVSQLKVAWTYRTGELGMKARSGDKLTFETTPIVSNGTLYLTTGFNLVIALDPATGTERWSFYPKVDRTRIYSHVTSLIYVVLSALPPAPLLTARFGHWSRPYPLVSTLFIPRPALPVADLEPVVKSTSNATSGS